MLNIFNTLKTYLIGFLLISSLISTGLYLSTRKDLKSLESKHTKLQSDYKELVADRDKLDESNKVNDSIILGLRKDLEKVDNNTDSKVNTITKYEKCKPSKPVNPQSENSKDEYVDIDAPFDPDFLRMYRGKSKASK
jgi:hypothetical protein